MSTDTLAQRIGAQLGDKIAAMQEWRDETIVDVLPENWLAVAKHLRDDAEFRFAQFIDLCGVRCPLRVEEPHGLLLIGIGAHRQCGCCSLPH